MIKVQRLSNYELKKKKDYEKMNQSIDINYKLKKIIYQKILRKLYNLSIEDRKIIFRILGRI